ncbi:1,2-phenylacetyl-CoA epoxidase, subunit E [Pandoraea pnomenusa]|uniref:1,2-phenylacetyl-CoA epoxidase, subunit E n=2 Tax=Burkholderiaceae TaxID=119060 RepID=A0A378YBZ1_9BURK|nr:Na(+)-translocating NADH-quinone reductase subunit F [Pandoraea pnomenusa]VVE62770.1 1,2-phenylacetyl-CoA epoxidase, subunit E [Pandoraea pnomenusa]
MYIVLTSRPGQYRSEPTPGITPVETHDYFYGARHVAAFVVAKLDGTSRVRIVDEADPDRANLVPTKFFESFDSVSEAVASLEALVGRDHAQARLSRRDKETSHSTMVQITFITNGGKTVEAAPNSNLLRVSLREKGGIPFKCGGGLCGTCRCRVEAGREHTDDVKPKERRHLSPEDLANGYRMACQTFVNGDVSVSW